MVVVQMLPGIIQQFIQGLIPRDAIPVLFCVTICIGYVEVRQVRKLWMMAYQCGLATATDTSDTVNHAACLIMRCTAGLQVLMLVDQTTEPPSC